MSYSKKGGDEKMKNARENRGSPERPDEVRPGPEQMVSGALGTENALCPPKVREVELPDGAAPL